MGVAMFRVPYFVCDFDLYNSTMISHSYRLQFSIKSQHSIEHLSLFLRLLVSKTFVLIITPFDAFADSTATRYSLWGGWAPTVNRAAFNSLPGYTSCCKNFTDSFGAGYWISFGVELPFASDFFWDNEVFYARHQSDFDEQQLFPVASNVRRDGLMQQHLDVSFNSFGAETGIIWAFSNIIHVGTSLVAAIRTDSHINAYEMLSPETPGTFASSDGFSTGSRIRNTVSGPMDAFDRFELCVAAAIYFNLPLNTDNSILLVPRLGNEYAFIEMAPNVHCHADNIRIGFGVSFSFAPDYPDSVDMQAQVPVQ